MENQREERFLTARDTGCFQGLRMLQKHGDPQPQAILENQYHDGVVASRLCRWQMWAVLGPWLHWTRMEYHVDTKPQSFSDIFSFGWPCSLIICDCFVHVLTGLDTESHSVDTRSSENFPGDFLTQVEGDKPFFLWRTFADLVSSRMGKAWQSEKTKTKNIQSWLPTRVRTRKIGSLPIRVFFWVDWDYVIQSISCIYIYI